MKTLSNIRKLSLSCTNKNSRLRNQIGVSNSRGLLNSFYLDIAGGNISDHLRLETDFNANRNELHKYIPKIKLPDDCSRELNNANLAKEIAAYLSTNRRRKFIDDSNASILDAFVSIILKSAQNSTTSCVSRCYNLLNSDKSQSSRLGSRDLPPLLVGWNKSSRTGSSVRDLIEDMPRFIHFAHPSNARNGTGQFTAIPDLVLEISLPKEAENVKRKRLVISAFEVREPDLNLIDRRTITRIFMYSLYLTKFNILELTGQLPDVFGGSSIISTETKSLHEVLSTEIEPKLALDAISKSHSTQSGAKNTLSNKARLPEVFLFFAVSGLQVQVSFLRTRDLLYASNEYFQSSQTESKTGPHRLLPLYLYGPINSTLQNHSFNLENPVHRIELAQVIYQTQKQFESLLCKPKSDNVKTEPNCGCS